MLLHKGPPGVAAAHHDGHSDCVRQQISAERQRNAAEERAAEETEASRLVQLDAWDHAAAAGRVEGARSRLALLREGALERLQIDGATAWLTEPQVWTGLPTVILTQLRYV